MAGDRASPRTLKKSIESVQRLMNAFDEEIPGFSRGTEKFPVLHGLEETEASITAKLNRGTFAATFFLATVKAIGGI